MIKRSICYTDATMVTQNQRKGYPSLCGFLRILKDENNQTIGLEGHIKFTEHQEINTCEADPIKVLVDYGKRNPNILVEIHSDSNVAIHRVKNSSKVPDNVTIHKVAGHSNNFGNEAIDRLLYVIHKHARRRIGSFTLEQAFDYNEHKSSRYHPLPALKELYNKLQKEGKQHEYAK